MEIQLWSLGENLGMETDTDTLHFLHNYASMECRDRQEAKELGNRKPPQGIWLGSRG